jgi:hypothetical protein
MGQNTNVYAVLVRIGKGKRELGKHEFECDSNINP